MSSGVIGIRFGDTSKTYCFTTEDSGIRKGDHVVVESDLGISLGRVVRIDCEMENPEIDLKPILRKATAADLKQKEENENYRKEAHKYCKERIEARGLDMKLLATEVTLDRKRYIFYFTAETRIDFRELVKDLASKFRTRIELRQIGVRDAARVIGGYGVCGREFCCKSFLKTFAPISIKMAKQQELVLNTCKLSGVCGRLMCCLSYEYEDEKTFRERKAREAEEARIAAEERRREEERLAEKARQEEEERRRQEEELKKRFAEHEAARKAASGESQKDGTEKQPSQKKRRRRPRRKGRSKQAGAQGQPEQQKQQPQAQQANEKKSEGGEKKKPRRRRRRPRKKPSQE